jgi:PPK2 family polyphosphate:nucleotide phosphotransferase
MSFSERFRVQPNQTIHLSDIDPGYKAQHDNKASAQAEIRQYAQRLRELQYLLYAENRRGLLICLQAMDSGGKDGTIRHVLGYMNPQGCRVQAFKVPTTKEAEHDFLWRVHQATPGRGEVVIFNRSHYEDVLVTRVHGLVAEKVWSGRYDAINSFEKYLSDNGVHILKFFLHISKDEQLKRFKKRLDDPNRHWKISEADYSERAFWDNYQRAYEDALSRCSTTHAPWFVVPADHKWFRNLAISRIVVEYLEGLGMHFPESTVDIADVEKKYHAEVRKEKNEPADA